MPLTRSRNEPILCMVVDDDPFMQDLLRDKLGHLANLKVVAVASSGNEAITRIRQHRPDLVFLDVEMPDLTGFEVLERLTDLDFTTIFVTSYNHYAIKAIRTNALDYILKPVDLQELKAAIQRFIDKRQRGMVGKKGLRPTPKAATDAEDLLVLNLQEGAASFPLSEILYLEGNRNYSLIHTTDGRKTLVAKTLATLEEMVDDRGFFRCHKSFIVNRRHLLGEVKKQAIAVAGGTKIPVSRRKLSTFTKWLLS